jgi:Flp pilus assembly protein TadG
MGAYTLRKIGAMLRFGLTGTFSRFHGTGLAGAPLREESFDEGTEIVEFSLVIIPMLGLVFLIMNVAWVFFAKASLQEAVREGVRYGVTGQVIAGQAGVASSVRQVVVQYAAGFVNTSNAQSVVSIQFLSPTTLTALSGVTACAGGNVIQVSVTNISVSPLAALLISPTALVLSASSSDVMESSPNGIPPSCL